MQTLDQIRATLRQHSGVLAETYGVAVSGVFGSYVRGEQREDSDLDLLADFLRPVSLFELVGAELYLRDVLKLHVDLVPRRSLRPELRNNILAESVPV
jgi:predicted nucleotidyltransferase